MKLCFHNILHIADSIENTGPCWATWQFPMERVCGMLVPLARSRLHPYKNIINNIHIWELFNYLQFYQTIYTKIFFSQQINKNEKKNVFSQDGVNEEFYYPSVNYKLSQSELKKIKEHFSVYYNVKNYRLKVKHSIIVF
jgi:hypothetical protein